MDRHALAESCRETGSYAHVVLLRAIKRDC